MKVFISPFFRGDDQGDGGIRRAVDGQRRYLPEAGIEVVDAPEDADLILVHITAQRAFLNRFPRTPVVLDCHGLYWSEYTWPKWALKANADIMETLRCADGVIAHSTWVAQALRRHTLRPAQVIPLGIDLEEWPLQASAGDYVLWNKNRIDPVCDPSPVLDLAQRLPTVPFVTTYLPEDADTAGLTNVEVTGRVPFAEAKATLQKAGIYLCTTRETFGVGTLEAMASGIPVVGWAWGGQREFLTHERDAWLCSPGDIDGLVEGLTWAVRSREQVVEAARKTAEAFSLPGVMRQYAAHLEEVYVRAVQKYEQPRTSVVIAVKDLETFLPDAVDSVLAQTDQDFECVIVDDASTDRTGEVADIYASHDSRISVVHRKESVGVSAARNTGVAAARGRYIIQLDGDDMFEPATLETLARVLDADRGIHLAYGNVKFVEEDGETPSDYGRLPPGHSGWPMPYRFDWHERGRNLMPYATMYRREVWERTCGYRARFKTAEDADFWLRAASYGHWPSYVTEQDTLIYRNRAGSLSRTQTIVPWEPWYPWSVRPALRPAAACAEADNLHVASLDPPFVSVIIPVGPGHEEIVLDAVDSVDAQTMRNFECIVINDSSAALPPLPAWVTVVTTAGSVGVAAARNAGVLAARSKLFVPLDADDYLQPEALSLLLAAYEQAGENTVVYGAWYDATEEGHRVYMPERFDPDTLMTHLRTRGALHAVTALYEKAAWSTVGGFDSALEAWEDWDFQIALYALGVCSVLVPQPLFVYRKHTGKRRQTVNDAFPHSKEVMLAKWRAFFEGGEDLAACGSCGARRAQQAQAPQPVNGDVAAAILSGGQTAELIEYLGKNVGNQSFRGSSGRIYTFGGGRNRIKYVLTQDVDIFLSREGFRKLPREEGLPQEPQVIA